MIDAASLLLSVAGLIFFLAGTVGILRFPDTHSRLHALTKADNLGLGLIALAVALQAESWAAIAKIVLIWALVLLAAGTSAQLVARVALQQGGAPGSGRDDAGPDAVGSTPSGQRDPAG